MKIIINDSAIELTDGATISQALASQNINATGIAVALNGTVVSKSAYGTTVLRDGDSLIIIKAFYGG